MKEGGRHVGRAILVMGIVICATAVLIALIVVGYRLVKGPAVSRARLSDAQRRERVAREALLEINAAAGQWSDVDSILATEVRRVVEMYERELRRTNDVW